MGASATHGCAMSAASARGDGSARCCSCDTEDARAGCDMNTTRGVQGCAPIFFSKEGAKAVAEIIGARVAARPMLRGLLHADFHPADVPAAEPFSPGGLPGPWTPPGCQRGDFESPTYSL